MNFGVALYGNFSACTCVSYMVTNTTMETAFRKYRKDAGLTQEELAAVISVRKPTISRYETGARRVPPERCRAISQAIGIPTHLLRPDLFMEAAE